MVESLNKSLQSLRENGFEGGRFKGIYVGDINSFVSPQHPVSSSPIHLFLRHIRKHGYLIRNSSCHLRILNCFNSLEDVSFFDTNREIEHTIVAEDDDVNVSHGHVQLSMLGKTSATTTEQRTLSLDQVKLQLFPHFQKLYNQVKTVEELEYVEEKLDAIHISLRNNFGASTTALDVFGSTREAGGLEKREKFSEETVKHTLDDDDVKLPQ
jgi:hypothetical protein